MYPITNINQRMGGVFARKTSRLAFLCGAPCRGKTGHACKLASRWGKHVFVVSSDVELRLGKPLSKSRKAASLSQYESQLEQAQKESFVILFDNAHLSPETLREKVYLAAAKHWMPLTNIAFFDLDEKLLEEEEVRTLDRHDQRFAWDIRARQSDAKKLSIEQLCEWVRQLRRTFMSQNTELPVVYIAICCLVVIHHVKMLRLRCMSRLDLSLFGLLASHACLQWSWDEPKWTL